MTRPNAGVDAGKLDTPALLVAMENGQPHWKIERQLLTELNRQLPRDLAVALFVPEK